MRPEEGLAFRLVLHLADGRQSVTLLRPEGVRLLSLPPLRVSWLDLVRIEEARRLLRAVGDEVLPGLRADDVPFALRGEDDQCVLVDHPRSPRGFRRYRGPCPVRGRIYVGRLALSGYTPHTDDLGGAVTAIFPYDPAWDVLPEAPTARRDESDASWRIEAVLHEACHVVWMREYMKDGPSNEVFEISPRAAAIEEAQIELLDEATSCEEEEKEKLLTLARDYLALRECRHEADAPTPRTQQRETTEGFAYFAARLAGKVAREKYEADLLRRADPFLASLYPSDPTDTKKPDAELRHLGMSMVHLNNYLYYRGVCQAWLLRALDPQALAAAWREGTLLPQALAKATGYDALKASERAKLKQEAMARWQCDRHEATILEKRRQAEAGLWQAAASARRDGDAVVLRVRVRFPQVNQRGPTREPQWRFYPVFSFPTDSDFALQSAQPCLFRLDQEKGWMELQTTLPRAGQLTLRRTGQVTQLQAGAVVIQANEVCLLGEPFSPLLLVECTHRFDQEQAKDGKHGTRPHSTLVPLEAALAGAPKVSRLPRHDMAATLSGVFLNGYTGQQQFAILDLLGEGDSFAGDWYFVAGERYTVTATMAGVAPRRVGRVAIHQADGTLLKEATADPPADRLAATATFVASDTAKAEWEVAANLREQQGWEARVTLKPGSAPPPLNRTATVRVFEYIFTGKGDWPWESRPLPNAAVTIWREWCPEEKLVAVTDAKGEATFTGLAAGGYLIEVSGAGDRCVVRYGPDYIASGGGWSTTLVPHYGIRGHIRFVDPSGKTVPGQPDRVKLGLYQGDRHVGDLAIEQPDADGSYPYHGPAEAPLAGDYHVRATYPPPPTGSPKLFPSRLPCQTRAAPSTTPMSGPRSYAPARTRRCRGHSSSSACRNKSGHAEASLRSCVGARVPRGILAPMGQESLRGSSRV